MKTTQVDSEVFAASNGGQSTPVALLLQPFTLRFALEVVITVTRGITPGQADAGLHRSFTLHWGTSAQALSGPQLAGLVAQGSYLQNLLNAKTWKLDPLRLVETFQTDQSHPRGQYLYVWLEYPKSADQYAITITATELFFNAGAGQVTVVAVNTAVNAASTTVVTASGVTISLPATPNVSDTCVVKNRSSNTITVSGNGNNIYATSSAATYVEGPGESQTFQWDGTYWNLI